MSRRTQEAFAAAAMCAVWFGIIGLFAVTANGQESCPDGQIRYDIVAGECEYGRCLENDEPGDNYFGVFIQGVGRVDWNVRGGCSVTCVCVDDEGLYWLAWANEGSWGGGQFITFWGGCQVPGPMPEGCLPPRGYVPLAVKGG